MGNHTFWSALVPEASILKVQVDHISSQKQHVTTASFTPLRQAVATRLRALLRSAENQPWPGESVRT